MLSIGELARRSGVKVPTIRYYETVGLFDPAERTEGNQRRYGPAEIDRLAFIRHARELGFPLQAIRELIDLSQHPQRPCAQADRIAAAQLASVRSRIDRLRRLERELARMAEHCGGLAGECDVLRSLADHSLCVGEH